MRKTTKDTLNLILLSIMAGMTLSIAGFAYLKADGLLGSILFSFGLFMIIIFGMKLYTGMVVDIPEMPLKNWWQLIVCFLFNSVGILISVAIIKLTIIGDNLSFLAEIIVMKKLNGGLLSAFASSVLCGMLITLSVLSGRTAKTKSLSGTVGILFPVLMFVYLGLDHSVANQIYFFLAMPELTLELAAYVLLTVIGNAIGGVILPLVLKFGKSGDESVLSLPANHETKISDNVIGIKKEPDNSEAPEKL